MPSVGGRPAGEEVADLLRRGTVVAAAGDKAADSQWRWKSDADQRFSEIAREVLGVDVLTSAELALRSAREYWLMPLVTTRPGSEVAATTWPPGHMQKL